MTYLDQHFKTVLVAAVAALGGCAAVDTKTIVSNSDAYLASAFTPAQLAQPVRTLVEKGDPLPKLFNRITYRVVADIDEEGKASQVTASSTFTNLGNGYIQNRIEYSRNGVPYRVNLALTFAGIYRLKTQTTFLDRANALQPLDTKELTRFDRALGKPRSGETYSIDAKTGPAPQMMNFADEKHVCTAGQAAPASTVFSGFSGSGIPIECTMTGTNGVVVGKSKFVWVADLGVAFQTEFNSARTTSRYKVESLEVQK